MEKPRLLIVEDEPEIADIIKGIFEERGINCVLAENGEVGFQKALQEKPDLILLDITLPKQNGYALCKQLKESVQTQRIPVIMLTAHSSEDEVVQGFKLGVEDYILKPFRRNELFARVSSTLQRHSKDGDDNASVLTSGNLKLDKSRLEASIDDTTIFFTAREFQIFWILMSTPGKVFTRNELLERLSLTYSDIIDRNIDVYIGLIRKKLGNYRNRITTIRGVGYKFVA